MICIILIVLQPVIVSAQNADIFTSSEADVSPTFTAADTGAADTNFNSSTEELPNPEDKLGDDILSMLGTLEYVPSPPSQFSRLFGVPSPTGSRESYEIDFEEIGVDDKKFADKLKAMFFGLEVKDSGSVVHWLRHKGFVFKPDYENIFSNESLEDFKTKKNLQEQLLQLKGYMNSGKINLAIARLNTIFDDILSEKGLLDYALVEEASSLIEELKDLGADEAAENYEKYLNDVIDYGETNAVITELNSIFDQITDDQGNFNNELEPKARELIENLKVLNEDAAVNYESYLDNMKIYSETAPYNNKISNLMNKMSDSNYNSANFQNDRVELLNAVDALKKKGAMDNNYENYINDFLKNFNTNRQVSDKNKISDLKKKSKRALNKQSLIDLFGFAQSAKNYAPEQSEQALEAIEDFEQGKVDEADVSESFSGLFETLDKDSEKIDAQLAEEVKRNQNIVGKADFGAQQTAQEFGSWINLKEEAAKDASQAKVYFEDWNIKALTDLRNDLTSILGAFDVWEDKISKQAFENRVEKNADAKCGLLSALSIGLNLLPAQNLGLFEDSNCKSNPNRNGDLDQEIVIIPREMKIYGKADISGTSLSGPRVLFVNPFGLVKINELEFPDKDNDGLLDEFDPDPNVPSEIALPPAPEYPEYPKPPEERVPEEEVPPEEPEEIPEVPPEEPEEEPEVKAPPLDDFYDDLPDPIPEEEKPKRDLVVKSVGFDERMNQLLDTMYRHGEMPDEEFPESVKPKPRGVDEFYQSLFPEESPSPEESEVTLDYCPDMFTSIPTLQAVLREIPVVYTGNEQALGVHLSGKPPAGLEARLNALEKAADAAEEEFEKCKEKTAETQEKLADEIEDLDAQRQEIENQMNELNNVIQAIIDSGKVPNQSFYDQLAELNQKYEDFSKQINDKWKQQEGLCKGEQRNAENLRELADKAKANMNKYDSAVKGEEDGIIYRIGIESLTAANMPLYYAVDADGSCSKDSSPKPALKAIPLPGSAPSGCDKNINPFCHPCQIKRIDEFLVTEKMLCQALDAQISNLENDINNMQKAKTPGAFNGLTKGIDLNNPRDFCEEVNKFYQSNPGMGLISGSSVLPLAIENSERDRRAGSNIITGAQAAVKEPASPPSKTDLETAELYREWRDVCNRMPALPGEGASQDDWDHYNQANNAFQQNFREHFEKLDERIEEAKKQKAELEKQKEELGCEEGGSGEDDAKGPVDFYLSFAGRLSSSSGIMSAAGMAKESIDAALATFQKLKRTWMMTQQQQAQIDANNNYITALKNRRNEIENCLAGKTPCKWSANTVNAQKTAFIDASASMSEQIASSEANGEGFNNALFESTKNLLFAANGPLNPTAGSSSSEFLDGLFKGDQELLKKLEDYRKNVLFPKMFALKRFIEAMDEEAEVFEALSGPNHGTNVFEYDISTKTTSVEGVIEKEKLKNKFFYEKALEAFDIADETLNNPDDSEKTADKTKKTNDMLKGVSQGDPGAVSGEPIIAVMKSFDESVSAYFDEAKSLAEVDFYLALSSAYVAEWYMGFGIQHANNLHQLITKQPVKKCEEVGLGKENCPNADGCDADCPMCPPLPVTTKIGDAIEVGLDKFVDLLALILGGASPPGPEDIGSLAPLLKRLRDVVEEGNPEKIIEILNEILELMEGTCGGENPPDYCEFALYKIKELMSMQIRLLVSDLYTKTHKEADRRANAGLKELGLKNIDGKDITNMAEWNKAIGLLDNKMVEEKKKLKKKLDSLKQQVMKDCGDGRSTAASICDSDKCKVLCDQIKNQQTVLSDLNKQKEKLFAVTENIRLEYYKDLAWQESEFLKGLAQMRSDFGHVIDEGGDAFLNKALDKQIENSLQLYKTYNGYAVEVAVNGRLKDYKDKFEDTAKTRADLKKVEFNRAKLKEGMRVSQLSSKIDELIKNIGLKPDMKEAIMYRLRIAFGELKDGAYTIQSISDWFSNFKGEIKEYLKRERKWSDNEIDKIISQLDVQKDKLSLIKHMDSLAEKYGTLRELAYDSAELNNKMQEYSKLFAELKEHLKGGLIGINRDIEGLNKVFDETGLSHLKVSEAASDIITSIGVLENILKNRKIEHQDKEAFNKAMKKLPYFMKKEMAEEMQDMFKADYAGKMDSLKDFKKVMESLKKVSKNLGGMNLPFLMRDGSVQVLSQEDYFKNIFISSYREAFGKELLKKKKAESKLKMEEARVIGLKKQKQKVTDNFNANKNKLEQAINLAELENKIYKKKELEKSLKELVEDFDKVIDKIDTDIGTTEWEIRAAQREIDAYKDLLGNVKEIESDLGSYSGDMKDKLEEMYSKIQEGDSSVIDDYESLLSRKLELDQELVLYARQQTQDEWFESAVLNLADIELKGIPEKNIENIFNLLQKLNVLDINTRFDAEDNVMKFVKDYYGKVVDNAKFINEVLGEYGSFKEFIKDFKLTVEKLKFEAKDYEKLKLIDKDNLVKVISAISSLGANGIDVNKFIDKESAQGLINAIDFQVREDTAFAVAVADIIPQFAGIESFKGLESEIRDIMKQSLAANVYEKYGISNREDAVKKINTLIGERYLDEEQKEGLKSLAAYCLLDPNSAKSLVDNLLDMVKINENLNFDTLIRSKQGTSLGKFVNYLRNFAEAQGFQDSFASFKNELKTAIKDELFAGGANEIRYEMVKDETITNEASNRIKAIFIASQLLSETERDELGLRDVINKLGEKFISYVDKSVNDGLSDDEEIQRMSDIDAVKAARFANAYVSLSSLFSDTKNNAEQLIRSYGGDAFDIAKKSSITGVLGYLEGSGTDPKQDKELLGLKILSLAMSRVGSDIGDEELASYGQLANTVYQTVMHKIMSREEMGSSGLRAVTSTGSDLDFLDNIDNSLGSMNKMFDNAFKFGTYKEALTYSSNLADYANKLKIKELSVTGIKAIDNVLEHYTTLEGAIELGAMALSGGAAGLIGNAIKTGGRALQGALGFTRGTNAFKFAVGTLAFAGEAYAFGAVNNVLISPLSGKSVVDSVFLSGKDFLHSALMLGGIKASGTMFQKLGQFTSSKLAKFNAAKAGRSEIRAIEKAAYERSLLNAKNALKTSERVAAGFSKTGSGFFRTVGEGFGMHTGGYLASLPSGDLFDENGELKPFFDLESITRSTIDAMFFKLGHKLHEAPGRLGAAIGKTRLGKATARIAGRGELLRQKNYLTEMKRKIKGKAKLPEKLMRLPERMREISPKQLEKEIGLIDIEIGLIDKGFNVPLISEINNYMRKIDTEGLTRLEIESLYIKSAKNLLRSDLRKIPEFRNIEKSIENLDVRKPENFKKAKEILEKTSLSESQIKMMLEYRRLSAEPIKVVEVVEKVVPEVVVERLPEKVRTEIDKKVEEVLEITFEEYIDSTGRKREILDKKLEIAREKGYENQVDLLTKRAELAIELKKPELDTIKVERLEKEIRDIETYLKPEVIEVKLPEEIKKLTEIERLKEEVSEFKEKTVEEINNELRKYEGEKFDVKLKTKFDELYRIRTEREALGEKAIREKNFEEARKILGDKVYEQTALRLEEKITTQETARKEVTTELEKYKEELTKEQKSEIERELSTGELAEFIKNKPAKVSDVVRSRAEIERLIETAALDKEFATREQKERIIEAENALENYLGNELKKLVKPGEKLEVKNLEALVIASIKDGKLEWVEKGAEVPLRTAEIKEVREAIKDLKIESIDGASRYSHLSENYYAVEAKGRWKVYERSAEGVFSPAGREAPGLIEKISLNKAYERGAYLPRNLVDAINRAGMDIILGSNGRIVPEFKQTLWNLEGSAHGSVLIQAVMGEGKSAVGIPVAVYKLNGEGRTAIVLTPEHSKAVDTLNDVVDAGRKGVLVDEARVKELDVFEPVARAEAAERMLRELKEADFVSLDPFSLQSLKMKMFNEKNLLASKKIKEVLDFLEKDNMIVDEIQKIVQSTGLQLTLESFKVGETKIAGIDGKIVANKVIEVIEWLKSKEVMDFKESSNFFAENAGTLKEVLMTNKEAAEMYKEKASEAEVKERMTYEEAAKEFKEKPLEEASDIFKESFLETYAEKFLKGTGITSKDLATKSMSELKEMTITPEQKAALEVLSRLQKTLNMKENLDFGIEAESIRPYLKADNRIGPESMSFGDPVLEMLLYKMTGKAPSVEKLHNVEVSIKSMHLSPMDISVATAKSNTEFWTATPEKASALLKLLGTTVFKSQVPVELYFKLGKEIKGIEIYKEMLDKLGIPKNIQKEIFNTDISTKGLRKNLDVKNVEKGEFIVDKLGTAEFKVEGTTHEVVTFGGETYSREANRFKENLDKKVGEFEYVALADAVTGEWSVYEYRINKYEKLKNNEIKDIFGKEAIKNNEVEPRNLLRGDKGQLKSTLILNNKIEGIDFKAPEKGKRGALDVGYRSVLDATVALTEGLQNLGRARGYTVDGKGQYLDIIFSGELKTADAILTKLIQNEFSSYKQTTYDILVNVHKSIINNKLGYEAKTKIHELYDSGKINAKEAQILLEKVIDALIDVQQKFRESEAQISEDLGMTGAEKLASEINNLERIVDSVLRESFKSNELEQIGLNNMLKGKKVLELKPELVKEGVQTLQDVLVSENIWDASRELIESKFTSKEVPDAMAKKAIEIVPENIIKEVITPKEITKQAAEKIEKLVEPIKIKEEVGLLRSKAYIALSEGNFEEAKVYLDGLARFRPEEAKEMFDKITDISEKRAKLIEEKAIDETGRVLPRMLWSPEVSDQEMIDYIKDIIADQVESKEELNELYPQGDSLDLMKDMQEVIPVIEAEDYVFANEEMDKFLDSAENNKEALEFAQDLLNMIPTAEIADKEFVEFKITELEDSSLIEDVEKEIKEVVSEKAIAPVVFTVKELQGKLDKARTDMKRTGEEQIKDMIELIKKKEKPKWEEIYGFYNKKVENPKLKEKRINDLLKLAELVGEEVDLMPFQKEWVYTKYVKDEKAKSYERFYLNIKEDFESIADLLRKLKESGLDFHFKISSNERNDKIVIDAYNEVDAEKMEKLLTEFAEENKDIFNSETVLFSKMISKGLSKAPSPVKAEESFGSVISAAIEKAIKEHPEMTSEELVKIVLESLSKEFAEEKVLPWEVSIEVKRERLKEQLLEDIEAAIEVPVC